MSKYKHISPQQARGYVVDDGQLSIAYITIIAGRPIDNAGYPYRPDGKIVTLIGWPDERAESFDNGALLIGLDQLAESQ